MSDTVKEFKNEDLQVKVNHEPNCVVRFEVTVSGDATKAAYAKAIKNVAKEVSIPGFRKGKAPANLLQERFKKAIDDEFRETVLNVAFKESTELSKIYPYTNKSIGDLKLDKLVEGEPAHIKFKFETYPQVPSINPSDLKLKKVNHPPIEEKNIQEVIDRIRRHQATWTEVIDRPAEDGDDVEVELTYMNASLAEPSQQTATYNLDKGKIEEKLYDILVGRSIGDELDGTPALQSSGPDAPNDQNCTIAIKRIRRGALPDISEEFLKKVGAESLEDLRSKIVKSLEKQVNQTVDELQREQVQLAMLEKYPFDLPDSFVKAEAKERLNQKLENLSKSKIKDAELVKIKEKFAHDAQQEAENYIRLQFMIFKLVRDQNIEPAQDEVVQFMLENMMQDPNMMQLKGEEMRERTVNMLKATKALDYIIQNAQVEE